MIITEEDKRLLLSLARNSIAVRLATGERENDPIPLPTASLSIHCGAFVSLYVEGKLRGCIGTFSEEETLYHNVRSMAISAAISDTRFTPVTSAELDRLKIEISVLSPRESIDDINHIILGKHGIYMKKGINRGTLLPQVAINQNWTLHEFLGNCAKYKAGIGWDGWKTADLYIYEAFVFNSDETAPNC